MKILLWVFIGGGAGSMARFGISKLLNNATFPMGTLMANVLASFVLGYLMAKNQTLAESSRYLLVVGFCGGFSTFSTFSFESFKLLQSGQYTLAAGHSFLNFCGCLGAIALAFYLQK